MEETSPASGAEDRVTVSLPREELPTLTNIIEDLRFVERTEEIKEEHDEEDYVPLSEVE